MSEREHLNDVELLKKTTGAVAESTAWHVIDTTEGFGGDVQSVTVESESGYDQYDGIRERVSVSDVNAGEWEVIN